MKSHPSPKQPVPILLHYSGYAPVHNIDFPNTSVVTIFPGVLAYLLARIM
jgi:hypothetical protein